MNKGKVIFPCCMPAGGGCPKVGAAQSQISHQASQTLMGSLSPLDIRQPAHGQACTGNKGNIVAPEADHLWEMYSEDGQYYTGKLSEVSDTESVYECIGSVSSIDGYSSGECPEYSLYDRLVDSGVIGDTGPARIFYG